MSFRKGRFKPRNPEKYDGDPTNVIFRSGWEFKVMMFLDSNTNVIRWNSEETIISYISPLDGKRHRYFPDFKVMMIEPNNPVPVTYILEVKPDKQTKAPEVRKTSQKVTKKYITEVMTYGINSAKFQAADRYCKKRGYIFKILTEKDLFKK